MRKYVMLFFGSFIFASGIRAQDNGALSDIVKSYTQYAQHHLREKIFLHTDRDNYVCGNILWFKAYVVNALNNKPLNLSKVVYVELLDHTGRPELQAKIPVSSDGTGNGSFDLPFTLESGNYELRAYTNMMRNDTSYPFFNKIITVLNTTKNLDSAIITHKKSYTVDFFPEGGNLVNGLSSVVGFKINDDSGTGIDSKGILTDNNNDTILHFSTAHFGMGRFSFTPEEGKSYTASVTTVDNSVIKKTLPQAYEKGLVMQVTDENDSQITISLNASGADINNLYVIVQAQQRVEVARAVALNNGSASVNIDKDALANGISVITVFNEKRQPVAERLYFKRPAGKMQLKAATNNTNYGLRNKVRVDLSTKDTVQDNLSISVYRIDDFNKPVTGDIFSYLWLSSDLKGFIEDPAYYFRDTDKETNINLDNLLLTQGWRRFSDEKLLPKTASSFTYIPEYYGHIVTGKITNTITGKPARDKLVYFSVPGKRVQLYNCISNSNGLFYFNTKNLYTGGQVVLQTNAGEDSSYRLELFNPFSEKGLAGTLPFLYVNENDQKSIEDAYVHMQIERAYYEKKLNLVNREGIDTLPFYYKPTVTYLLDDYTRFVTMEEVMREYVKEVNVLKKGKNFRFLTLNNPAIELDDFQIGEKIFSDNPLILLDGVPVSDVNKIAAYDPLKVEKLEVVAARYYWGRVKAEGIVSYTTYKGNLDGFTLDPGDVILDYGGLQEQRIFYSPDYSDAASLQGRLPDMREVLYWNPSVKTTSGKQTLSFYTGDVAGKYLGVVQGLSENGLPVTANFIFDVKK